MPAFAKITPDKLARLIGSPKAPIILDVRDADDLTSDPRLIPTSRIMPNSSVADWAPSYAGKSVIVVCKRGKKLSEGVAAWLRHFGASAENLEGGTEAWAACGLPLVPISAIPKSKIDGTTVWVTRSRPKVDRIACPWLIRRFVDPGAVFLFVAASEVAATAERFDATPFDIEGVHWSHRGEFCTFDVMLEEFGLTSEPLSRLATIVRGADTARLNLAPEAAGLLAASLGLSRLYSDDLEQLAAGMVLYDALYRWARDATDESHDWTVSSSRSAKP